MAWRSVMALLVVATVAVAAPPTLDGLRLREESGLTRIDFDITGAVEPEVEMLADHRLVVDLAGVEPRLRQSEIPFESDRLLRARIGRHHEPREKTRVVLDLRGPARFEVEPTASGFTIALGNPEPIAAAPAEETDAEAVALASPSPMANARPRDRLAPGGVVSINFHEADLRTVIDLVAAVGGYDVVFTPEVQGKLTVKIDDRPWEEALETILEEKHLRATHQEDWIEISPAESADALSEGARP